MKGKSFKYCINNELKSHNVYCEKIPIATRKHVTLQAFQHNGYRSLAHRETKLPYSWRGRMPALRAAPANPFTHEQGQLFHSAPPSPQPCFSRVSFFLSAAHPTSAQASQDGQAAGSVEGVGGHAGPAFRPVCTACLPSGRPHAVQLS